jgi:hypothetical protein
MPFNLTEFQAEVEEMTDYKLAEAKKKYTRSASGGSIGSGISLFLGPFCSHRHRTLCLFRDQCLLETRHHQR